MPKRTLDAYLVPKPVPTTETSSSSKRLKETMTTIETTTAHNSPNEESGTIQVEAHSSYPFPIIAIDVDLYTALKEATPDKTPKAINNQPNLDLLYYEPFIPKSAADEYFKFLRRGLLFLPSQIRHQMWSDRGSHQHSTIYDGVRCGCHVLLLGPD